MDPALSSQYPVHKIGSDGFAWWVGQIESKKNGDPKKSGRYRVRIVGTHLKDAARTPSSELPWANTMMPATVPWSDGGVTGGSVGYDIGNWVIGFFLDNDKQKPIIMGSIGHTAGATLLENVENDPNPAGTAKEFTTFLDPRRNPYKHLPLNIDQRRDALQTEEQQGSEGQTLNGQAGLTPAATETPPPVFYGLFGQATETNPTGSKVCVEIANPKCGTERNFSQSLKNVIAEMLRANQQSGGNLGSYYVSKINGELSPYIQTGRRYINKAIRLVKSFIARLKGEIVKILREAVEQLVTTVLYANIPSKDELGNTNTGPVNPDLGIKPFTDITVKKSRLKEVIDIVNEVLDDLGCSMENLTERISDYLTDLLFGYLMDAYSAVACLVDTLVNGIINEIISFIDESLSLILGGLNELLGVLAKPLNLIGSIINKAFDLLGISCDGPTAQCDKIEKVCVDCANDETDDNWLDNLLEQIEDGPLDNRQYICKEAREQQETEITFIQFVGGIPAAVQDPATGKVVPTVKLIQYTSEDIEVIEGQEAVFVIKRFGDVSVSSSIRLKVIPKTATTPEDFEKTFEGSVIGFAPYETQKQIKFRTYADRDFTEEAENFFIRIKNNTLPDGHQVSFPNGRDFQCTIKDGFNQPVRTPPNVVPGLPPSTPPGNERPDGTVPIEIPIQNINPPQPRYSVVPERTVYTEGESVAFNIYSVNGVVGSAVDYELDVSPDDIVEGEVTGSFILDENGQGRVIFTLAPDNDNVRIDPPGTIPLLDETGTPILDENGAVQYNTEEIITDIPDDNERLTLTITSTGDRASVLILGEDDGDPAYFVSSDKEVYDEGDTITYTINTRNIPDNNILNYTITGTVDADDFVEKDLTGSFTIVDNQAQVQLTIAEDAAAEQVEIITFSIDGTNTSLNVLISPQQITTVEEEELILPTYSVSTDKFVYDEGETIQYTITTTNVPDGTTLQYYLNGTDVKPSDFVGNTLQGSFVVINNTATVYLTIAEDNELEVTETVTFFITGTNGFASVVINGEEEETEDVPDEIIEEKPCLDKPIADEPITDETGSILSIPLISKGCPYVEPPFVIIGGAGTGAAAIPLLDEEGRVSEIRLTRAGAGYRKNTAADKNVTCVIDSFTLLNVGLGYTSAPEVFVNGEAGIARAIIDEERGIVTSVQIIDRSLEFTQLPSIIIQGGGGSGARVLPSVVCLDNIDELAASGYAKIGTGKYIDCP